MLKLRSANPNVVESILISSSGFFLVTIVIQVFVKILAIFGDCFKSAGENPFIIEW